MAKKVKITDGQGTQVFPITHVSAVIDNNGNSVEQVLGAQTDLINQKQLEIGAVPSDLTPTAGSAHWVTSGGVYRQFNGVPDDIHTVTINATSGSSISRQTKYDCELKSGRTYLFTKASSVVGSGNLYCYDSNDTETLWSTFGAGEYVKELTAPFDIKKVSVYASSGQVSASGTLTLDFSWRSGEYGIIGDLKANTERKFDCKVNIGCKNLYDSSKTISGYALNNSGQEVADNNYLLSDYIPVVGGTTYAVSSKNSSHIGGFNKYHCFYDINKIFIANSAVASNNSTVTSPQNAAYLRISIYTAYVDEVQVEVGNSRTSYETYNPIAGYVKPTFSLFEKQISDKLDKVYGENLVNPSTLLLGAALSWDSTTGEPSTGYSDTYKVSDYIPVNEQNIIANSYYMVDTWSSMYVYDANKNFLRSLGATAQYTYQSGDAYVRINFKDENPMANYGTTLKTYEPYTDYKPLSDLKERVDAIDGGTKIDVEHSELNSIYLVYNSINSLRNYSSKIWLSHFLFNSAYKNKEIFFGNGQRYMPFTPSSVQTRTETSVIVDIKPKSSYNDAQLTFKQRIVNNVASKNVTPKVLVIGDSVTSGYGSNSNKDVSWLPNQYWAYSKMFFEMDKIDGGDNVGEYEAIFIGRLDGNFSLNYGGVTRSIKAKAEARGGAALQELFNLTWGDGGTTPNPFYDSNNNTFSVLDYLRRYRTMDDLGVRLPSTSVNPAGEAVVGSDGLTYSIGSDITTQSLLESYDVCSPSHIVINMVQNTTLANYQNYIGQIISIIQNELPNVPIILAVIDETGTLFPIDYPNYIESQITYASLHTKNLSIYNWLKNNIEDEANGVYLLGLNFIQPTARSYATIPYVSSDSVEKTEKEQSVNVTNPSVSGASYHPNNYAHAAWGYSLYSMIKYLITS